MRVFQVALALLVALMALAMGVRAERRAPMADYDDLVAQIEVATSLNQANPAEIIGAAVMEAAEEGKLGSRSSKPSVVPELFRNTKRTRGMKRKRRLSARADNTTSTEDAAASTNSTASKKKKRKPLIAVSDSMSSAIKDIKKKIKKEKIANRTAAAVAAGLPVPTKTKAATPTPVPAPTTTGGKIALAAWQIALIVAGAILMVFCLYFLYVIFFVPAKMLESVPLPTPATDAGVTPAPKATTGEAAL